MNFLMVIVGSLVLAGFYIAFRYTPERQSPAVVEQAEPQEVSRQYLYDEQNRLIGVRYSDGTRVEFVYDERGNMVERKVTQESNTQQVVMSPSVSP